MGLVLLKSTGEEKIPIDDVPGVVCVFRFAVPALALRRVGEAGFGFVLRVHNKAGIAFHFFSETIINKVLRKHSYEEKKK